MHNKIQKCKKKKKKKNTGDFLHKPFPSCIIDWNIMDGFYNRTIMDTIALRNCKSYKLNWAQALL